MSRPPANRPFACEGLDRVLHEKARLGILAALAAHERGLSFNDLKALCALTDGNLSRHLQVLQEAGIVSVRKGQEGVRPQTTAHITARGRDRFVTYLADLEKVIVAARGGLRAAPDPVRRPGLASG